MDSLIFIRCRACLVKMMVFLAVRQQVQEDLRRYCFLPRRVCFLKKVQRVIKAVDRRQIGGYNVINRGISYFKGL